MLRFETTYIAIHLRFIVQHTAISCVQHIDYIMKFRHFHSFRANQFWTISHNYFFLDPLRGDVSVNKPNQLHHEMFIVLKMRNNLNFSFVFNSSMWQVKYTNGMMVFSVWRSVNATRMVLKLLISIPWRAHPNLRFQRQCWKIKRRQHDQIMAPTLG